MTEGKLNSCYPMHRFPNLFKASYGVGYLQDSKFYNFTMEMSTNTLTRTRIDASVI
jgi:hypothetical protein